MRKLGKSGLDVAEPFKAHFCNRVTRSVEHNLAPSCEQQEHFARSPENADGEEAAVRKSTRPALVPSQRKRTKQRVRIGRRELTDGNFGMRSEVAVIGLTTKANLAAWQLLSK